MGNISEASARSAMKPAGTTVFSDYRPHPPAALLRDGLLRSQSLTDTLLRSFEGTRLSVPMIPIVNPPLWEIGHVGWFNEFWVHRAGAFDAPSIVAGADALYDSARVHHDSRWTLALPDFAATRRNVASVLEGIFDRLDSIEPAGEPDDRLSYFIQLALLHQDMHNEAFFYTCQTLGYPVDIPAPVLQGASVESSDVHMPAARMELGARKNAGFVFDNEKWAHEMDVPAFAIARTAVSNAEFMRFVEDGGYARREFWSDAGWQMREALGLAAPRYWLGKNGSWQVKRFDRVIDLPAREPVMHVSWHEAKAYCHWAGRRLPTEAEWERAAATAPGTNEKRSLPWGASNTPEAALANLDARCAGPVPVDALAAGDSGWGVRQMLGNVWEWTESRFAPYPGFSADPYKEYSEPWFAADHRVLRGGSFATPLRLIRTGWRNFYPPHRADPFCGFRTCALDK